MKRFFCIESVGFRPKAQGWRHELPWVTVNPISTLNGLRHLPRIPTRVLGQIHRLNTTLSGLVFDFFQLPRVARASQPWALLQNPVGIPKAAAEIFIASGLCYRIPLDSLVRRLQSNPGKRSTDYQPNGGSVRGSMRLCSTNLVTIPRRCDLPISCDNTAVCHSLFRRLQFTSFLHQRPPAVFPGPRDANRITRLPWRYFETARLSLDYCRWC